MGIDQAIRTNPFRGVIMKYSLMAVAVGLTIVSWGNDPNDPGRQRTGKLTGSLELHTLDGSLLADASGVTVSVEGTSCKAISAADGTWHIDGLPSGTYMIDYSKTGFAGFRILGYQFTGGGEAFIEDVDVVLGEQSAVRTTALHAEVVNQADTVRFGEPMLDITATFSEPVSRIVAFFSTSPSLAPDSGRYTTVRSLNWGTPASSITTVLTDIEQLKSQGGYKSGDVVYMTICSLGYGGTVYRDPRMRQLVYSGAIPAIRSNVASFTIP
jgi:hypothetical protein